MTLKHSLNSWQHYGVIMNQTTSHRHYMISDIQAWLDRKQTHTNRSEFSGSVGHRCTGLQALTWPCLVISCANMQCVASLPGETLASFIHLLGSELCCLWLLRLRFCYILLRSPYHMARKFNISYNHLITLSGFIIASEGHTRVITVSCVLSATLFFLLRCIFFFFKSVLTIPSHISHPAEKWFQPKYMQCSI